MPFSAFWGFAGLGILGILGMLYDLSYPGVIPLILLYNQGLSLYSLSIDIYYIYFFYYFPRKKKERDIYQRYIVKKEKKLQKSEKAILTPGGQFGAEWEIHQI